MNRIPIFGADTSEVAIRLQAAFVDRTHLLVHRRLPVRSHVWLVRKFVSVQLGLQQERQLESRVEEGLRRRTGELFELLPSPDYGNPDQFPPFRQRWIEDARFQHNQAVLCASDAM